jgi:hypothetical protein
VIVELILHGFADASFLGCCAVIYAVIKQAGVISQEFLMSFKRFIAARGCLKKIISDNGKTFVAAAKWIKKVVQNEKLQGYWSEHGVKWQFNLSKASWWGGTFERMVSIVKQALYKVVASAKLIFT